MFDMMFRMLPEWAMPVVIGCIAWFFANYLFITGWFVERAYLHDGVKSTHCERRIHYRRNKFDFALYTATLGLYDSANAPLEERHVTKIKKEGVCAS
ncbi:MAG: hypothetical protein AAF228_05940 [Pseudomonadota bacterium]